MTVAVIILALVTLQRLGELVLPETASDVIVDCACPDDSGACVHALAVTYEFCAAADAGRVISRLRFDRCSTTAPSGRSRRR